MGNELYPGIVTLPRTARRLKARAFSREHEHPHRGGILTLISRESRRYRAAEIGLRSLRQKLDTRAGANVACDIITRVARGRCDGLRVRFEHVSSGGQYDAHSSLYRDYYVRGRIIRTNTYVDVRAITKMTPLNSSTARARDPSGDSTRSSPDCQLILIQFGAFVKHRLPVAPRDRAERHDSRTIRGGLCKCERESTSERYPRGTPRMIVTLLTSFVINLLLNFNFVTGCRTPM